MKTEERALWLMVAGITTEHYEGTYLCSFCRYVEWDGWSRCESYPVCQNKLVSFHERIDTGEVWAGGDCWVFTPQAGLKLSGAVDLVGFWVREMARYQRERTEDSIAWAEHILAGLALGQPMPSYTRQTPGSLARLLSGWRGRLSRIPEDLE